MDRARIVSVLFAGVFAFAAKNAVAHEVVAPVPIEQPAPAWPGGHADDHDVIVPVVVVVDERGVVTSAEVESSVSAAFDAAAIEATKGWKFSPAKRDRAPVSAKVRSVVRFVAASAAPMAPAVKAEPSNAPAPSEETVHVEGARAARSASETRRDREALLAAPHRTGSDLLNVVPGVFVTQHSGEGKAHQIFMRGFDAVHGQDVELWVGGVPINEVSNIHGQGYADLHFVMPEVVREVQSTPGTYDPRQGDFAVAGTVRMKLGYPEPGGTIKGALGSFGSQRLFLAYHPKNASDETFAAFESYSTDGFGPNRAARRGSMIAQATHDFADGPSLRVLGTLYAGRFDSAGVLPAADIESGRADRFAVYDPKQGGYSSRASVLVELHHDDESAKWSIAPFVVLRTLHLRQNFTGYFIDTQRGGAPKLDSDNTQQINESLTLGATASYTKTVQLLSKRDAIEVGVYGRHDVISQSQRRLSDVNDAPTETLVDADVRGTNMAGYVDATLHPVTPLAIRGGIRGDVLSYAAQDRSLAGQPTPAQGRAAEGGRVGKKLTLDYAFGGGVRALASYGEGFRSPQARSLSEGERTFFTEVTSYEVGVRYSSNRVAGSLAAFYTRLTDDLVFDPATARNERVPGTDRKGIASEVTIRPAHWFLMTSSLTYTNATFTGSNVTYGEGDLLPYVPQVVVRTDAVVKRKLARAFDRDLEGRIGVGLEGIARRPLPYSEMGQNVSLVDLAAGLRLKEVELGLDVFNLFDAKWYDGQFVYASNFGRTPNPPQVPFRHVTVGAPRTVFVSLALYL